MRARPSFLLPLLALLAAAPLSAAPSLSGLLDPALLSRLKSEGRAVRAVQGEEAARAALLPLHRGAGEIGRALAAEGPSILVEALFLLERPAPASAEEEILSVYGLLRSFSSLEGIEYWSASRNTWRTFYAESYRIDGPATRRRLPDEAPPRSLPPAEELFALQRDLSFGENVYRYRFQGRPGSGQEGPAVLVEQTNLTRMSYGLLPVLGAEGLRTRLFILPAAEGILFYAASASSAPALPGLRGKLENSFSNRAEALFRWFSRELPRP